ncbi:hypothetical protein [Ruegeria atlantica]|uniref:hypothetical protein n=1 Tax=Ruegeria atlantica TaxID=81569 RepID=UPI0034A04737
MEPQKHLSPMAWTELLPWENLGRILYQNPSCPGRDPGHDFGSASCLLGDAGAVDRSLGQKAERSNQSARLERVSEGGIVK